MRHRHLDSQQWPCAPPPARRTTSGLTCRPVKGGCSLHSASAQHQRLAGEALIRLGSRPVSILRSCHSTGGLATRGFTGNYAVPVGCERHSPSRMHEGMRLGVLLPIRHCNVSGWPAGSFLCCWDRGSHGYISLVASQSCSKSMMRNRKRNAAAVASRKQG